MIERNRFKKIDREGAIEKDWPTASTGACWERLVEGDWFKKIVREKEIEKE